MRNLAQNIMESGAPIDEVIGDFHDGHRDRMMRILIMGQLAREVFEMVGCLLATVGWPKTEQKEKKTMCFEHEKDALRNIRWVVERQVEDEAMCEQPQTPEEAYFRRELLRLHSIVEAYCDQVL